MARTPQHRGNRRTDKSKPKHRVLHALPKGKSTGHQISDIGKMQRPTTEKSRSTDAGTTSGANCSSPDNQERPRSSLCSCVTPSSKKLRHVLRCTPLSRLRRHRPPGLPVRVVLLGQLLELVLHRHCAAGRLGTLPSLLQALLLSGYTLTS